MAREYHYLVAGLREYTLDSDNKGFNAEFIKDDILAAVSTRDARYVHQLYEFYDIENIINLRAGRSTFNELGNFLRDELEDEIKRPQKLPAYIRRILEAYNATDKVDYEEINTEQRFEKTLFEAYYNECARSKCRFIRDWYEFDQNLRNIGAAYKARRTGRMPEEAVIGDSYVSEQLALSSAADFGLKGEIDYIDKVVAAVDEGENLIEKERKIDDIRWNMSEELVEFDYFNINTILSYLVRVNIVNRWMTMDEKTGREMFVRLLHSLNGKDIIGNAKVKA